jgi:hypothetical protein
MDCCFYTTIFFCPVPDDRVWFFCDTFKSARVAWTGQRRIANIVGKVSDYRQNRSKALKRL